MKNLIDKYIERIKIDFPEDDKLMIDLQDFAKEIQAKQSILSEVGIMFKDKQINRFEVIDKIGRAYVNYCDRPLKIEASLQDNERTLKIFLDD